MKKMAMENHQITIREVADDIVINFSIVLIAKCAQEVLNDVENDPEPLKRVIIGDETWYTGMTSKPRPWKLLEEPRWKKIPQVSLNAMVFFTVFFDFNGSVRAL